MEYFLSLPEGCISEIFSLTSPKDVGRSSAVSQTFMFAAESVIVWEEFLPSDYEDIISRSDSFLASPSKKQLYFSLSNSPILLDGGEVSFSLDKNGKKCFMVAARELAISRGDILQYWNWLSHPDSRFSEVAKLKWGFWLDIRGKIETQILSKRTKYVAFLVFKLEDGFRPLKLPMHMLDLLIVRVKMKQRNELVLCVFQPKKDLMRSNPIPREELMDGCSMIQERMEMLEREEKVSSLFNEWSFDQNEEEKSPLTFHSSSCFWIDSNPCIYGPSRLIVKLELSIPSWFTISYMILRVS
ncbi:hypothetical protein K7X08_027399 [Anisodus acutangulus]|uniref:F-box domain-containing protein n=1 Tax=Anisodus acutangulus TaxID=402998 RepID=A0A9Q1RKY6_9SOLA|nr:hypothetical protein K7X08_027399 [Anisodus acutangulus]